MQADIAEVPVNAGAAALRAFFNIADKWGLRSEEAQVLLAVPRPTYFRWKKTPEKANVTHDTMERLSYVLGIFKGLRLIYSDNALADSWLQRPNDNPVFGGSPPLKRMLGGQVVDLYMTRQVVDARRGVI